MPSYNRVELIGNIGKISEPTKFQSGDLQIRFSLATNEEWQDKKTGEMVKRVDWHNVVVNDQNAVKFTRDYLKKGNLVAVFGQLKNREFDNKDGIKQRVTEVVVDRFNGKLIGLEPKPQLPG